MGGPAHSAGDLAAFQDGEERLVYARFKDAPHGPPFFLKDGLARDKAFKAWVPEHLECLMPECSDRRLVAVNRSEHSGRRDGFRHNRGAGGHSAESLFHQQGKALVQTWVSHRYPEATVRVEAPTTSRDRVADVMVTFPDGRQVAVEIQYAALSANAWLARHRSYLDQGVTPVWLLGHTSPHMNAHAAPFAPGHTATWDRIAWSTLHQEMTRQGAMVLWINPIQRALATPWTVDRVTDTSHDYAVSCQPDTDHVFATVDILDGTCTLDPESGLVTPTMRRLVESEEQRRAAIAAAAQAEAERCAAWLASLLHQQMLGRFDGQIPEIFTGKHDHSDAIDLYPPTWWHCLLYDRLIRDRPPGTALSVDACVRVLTDERVSMAPLSRSAIWAFLRHLDGLGVVKIYRDRRREVVRVVINRDPGATPVSEDVAAEVRRHKPRPATVRRRPYTPNPAVPMVAGESGWTHCRTCGLRLDPVLSRSGYHVGGCAPGIAGQEPEPDDPLQEALF